jgi:hypothetical protein
VLSNEVMGGLALAILWVNVLLVAAASAQQIRAVLARRDALSGVARGRVVRGDGPGAALAAHRVEQVGRAAAGTREIHFHDRLAEDEVFGGAITLDDGKDISLTAGAPAEVWVSSEAMERAAARPPAEAVERAYASALETRGFAHAITATVAVGDEVFVDRPGTGAILVSTMDPRALLTRKAALGVAFITAAVAAAAGGTALALWPPVFGAVSKVGAVFCLGFFLAVQPAGTRARDAMLVPGRVPVRGLWPLASPPTGPTSKASVTAKPGV